MSLKLTSRATGGHPQTLDGTRTRTGEEPSKLVAIGHRLALRQGAIVVHRYVGLLMALFLIIAGLTGSVLAFYHELDAALNPRLFRAPPPTEDAAMLDPFALLAAAEAQVPKGLVVSNLPLDTKEGDAFSLWVEPRDAADPDGIDDEYLLSPYTGELLGSRRWGDLGQGKKNLMPFVYRLHYSLALGDVGTYLFGVIALLWTLDCFAGAYLTFPPPRRTDGSRTGKSWFARWKPSWLLQANKLFSFVFTWHRASGLWVWAMLFVFAWSAVGLNLREVYNPVMESAFGLQERVWDTLPQLETPRTEPKLSFQQAYRRLRVLMAQEAARQGFEVHEERSLGYAPQSGTYHYRVYSSRDISDRYPGTRLWIDGDSGDRVAFDPPTGRALGNTITTWLYHLHFGSASFGGWPYRVFVCLMGVAVAALSVTGVWIWWRKRSKRVAAQRRSIRRNRTQRAG